VLAVALAEEFDDLVAVVPGLCPGAAGVVEPAAVDEAPDAAEGDAELPGDLVGGHVASGEVQGFHQAAFCWWRVLLTDFLGTMQKS
jgi:hypothetical protein